MGTHPIFESDFDCLTDKMLLSRRAFRHVKNVAQARTKIAKDLAGNRLVYQAENPFDCARRCKLCGTGISYKNTQLISQFVSPYTGRLYTENTTGLCTHKYKELKASYDVAKKVLLLGPAKEPVFMNDEIGPAHLGKHPMYSRKAEIADKLGAPDTRKLDDFRRLLSSDDPVALESTDMSKEELLQEADDRWLTGDQIQYLFAETEDFDLDGQIDLTMDSISNREVAEARSEHAPEPDFDDDWLKKLSREVEEKHSDKNNDEK